MKPSKQKTSILPLFIALIIIPLCIKSQISYQSKTLFKYNKEDGWVRIIEREWITIDNKGDTTFWQGKKGNLLMKIKKK
jgi:hypothetical protein